MRRFLFSVVMLTVCSSFMTESVNAFQFGTRWNRTATDGTGLQLGDPTTLTWGFVGDGTNISSLGSSDLIATFDSWYGSGAGGSDLTNRPWFPHFENSFNRYGEVSGLTYVYEPNDDGLTQGSSANRGILGTRADVRIAGDFIDGTGAGGNNTLAFNSFPQNGDMTFDTGSSGGFTNSANNFRFLRNVIMHEHGHGTGYFHVESTNSGQLMEPFIQTFFDGPQFGDILGLHRGYGDFYEKSNNGNGNDVISNATNLGLVAPDTTVQIGTHANNNFVPNTESDFVSIDDNSDIDFYSFEVGSLSDVSILLEPMGPTYNQGPQGGSQAPFVTKSRSDLVLTLYNGIGSILTTVDLGAFGDSESITDFNVDAGQYFVRVSSPTNNVQMYQLDISADEVTLADPGDFDGNGAFECTDVDSLVTEIVAGTNNDPFDLTGEGDVNSFDLQLWLALAGFDSPSGVAFVAGDANLDGVVDGTDFEIWSENKFTTNAAYCSGDFDGDGQIGGHDFLTWNENRSAVSAVPEPNGLLSLAIVFAAFALRRRS